MAKVLMVVGFLFTTTGNQVLLIEKKTPKGKALSDENARPQWMNGKLNGLGGIVKDGESAIDCLVRKVQAECGIVTAQKQWEPFHELHSDGGDVVILFAKATISPQSMSKIISPTDETCALIDTKTILNQPIVGNLSWLVQMALDTSHNYSASVDYIDYPAATLDGADAGQAFSWLTPFTAPQVVGPNEQTPSEPGAGASSADLNSTKANGSTAASTEPQTDGTGNGSTSNSGMQGNASNATEKQSGGVNLNSTDAANTKADNQSNIDAAPASTTAQSAADKIAADATASQANPAAKTGK